MNKICLVARNFDTYFIRRFQEEVDQNRCVFFNPWVDSVVPKADVFLVRSSGIYQSDTDLEILNLVPRAINSLPSLKLHRSKVTQYEHYLETGAILPWLRSAENLDSVMEFLRLQQQVVCKPHRGQGGWGIELLNELTFPLWWEQKMRSGDWTYLLQKFCVGSELRVFFIGQDFRLTLERRKHSSLTANFATGGEAFVTQLPQALRERVENIINHSGAFYGAVDLLWDGGTLALLEVNTVPGIEQLEQVSGMNVMGELLKRMSRAFEESL